MTDSGQAKPRWAPWKIGALAVVCGVAGAFGGGFGWQLGQEWLAARRAAEADAAAQAFRQTPEGRQQEAVLRQLHDPVSAQFRNVRVSPRRADIYCGEVNARNRLGGMVGFTRYMVDFDELPELREFDEVRMEPTSRADVADDNGAFQSRWGVFCAG